MGMDLQDQRYFDEKFSEIREVIDDNTKILHARISEHAEKDEVVFEKIGDKLVAGIRLHEETHHAIGWPKVILILVSLVGAICGIVALMAHNG